ncbi:alpha/beta fold hydrolase [Chenggangzhangella methanolivorans]|uniref:alpha/beta fold hydrolase n=1 Tax=Chenggangzhangella methanolivorans TaxID=1437009 RepID=UPI0021BDEA81|nr:alpha/beta fold hydrolase [Chenggangzhangella methanolivorans]
MIAPDLPGHAFTDPLPYGRTTLPGMAEAVGALLKKLGARPRIIVGHSAGAAIAIRMALDGHAAPDAIVSLNGAVPDLELLRAAVLRRRGEAAGAEPAYPLAVRAPGARPGRRAPLLDGTGSEIDPLDEEIYGRLATTTSHVSGALGMMAGWDLHALEDDLSKLETPLLLVVGEADAMVPPGRAAGVARLAKNARVVCLQGLGHLAHEEAPGKIHALIGEFAPKTAAPEQKAAAHG